jgi:dynein heavy chain
MHYDWGLRATKTVLVVAGMFLRAEPEVSEGDMLMRTLRDTNMPKLTIDDCAVFQGLLNDLFPGRNPPKKYDETLYE